MRRVAVVLLMGLPGSGKTTLCQKLLEMRPEGVQFRHICYDELLKVNEAEKWRDSRDNIIKQVEHLIVNSGDASEMLIILIDDNFYYQSMRRMYFKMAKKHKVPTCILYLQCSTEVAVSRVEERSANGGLSVDSETIRLMAQKLEPPVEHNWENYSLKISSDVCEISLVWKSLVALIESAFENQLRLDDLGDEIPSAHEKNPLQDADLVLRKFISSEMHNFQSKGVDKLEMAQLAQKLNSDRKRFLKQLSDNINVTDLMDQFRLFVDR